jgi:hypothetical protein
MAFIPTCNVLPEDTAMVEFRVRRSDAVQRGQFATGRFIANDREYGWQHVQCWRYPQSPQPGDQRGTS